jgi:5'-nucleotidase
MNGLRILVDLDGVVADWGGAYGRRLDAYGAAAAGIPRHRDQLTFDLNEGRTDAEKRIIAAIMVEPGFYAELEPIAGARSVLKALRAQGHEIYFVTSPWVSNPTCASDKLNWVARVYGDHWAQRTIITSEKHLVRGDVLIDDKPEIKNAADAEWRHILFTQPYNAHIDDHRARLDSWTLDGAAWAITQAVMGR